MPSTHLKRVSMPFELMFGQIKGGVSFVDHFEFEPDPGNQSFLPDCPGCRPQTSREFLGVRHPVPIDLHGGLRWTPGPAIVDDKDLDRHVFQEFCRSFDALQGGAPPTRAPLIEQDGHMMFGGGFRMFQFCTAFDEILEEVFHIPLHSGEEGHRCVEAFSGIQGF